MSKNTTVILMIISLFFLYIDIKGSTIPDIIGIGLICFCAVATIFTKKGKN